MKKIGVVILGVIFAIASSYAGWCVRENYKTGEWTEACGLIITNPHYRDCIARRAWVPKIVPDKDDDLASGLVPKTAYQEPTDAGRAKDRWEIESETVPGKPGRVVFLHGGDTIKFADEHVEVKPQDKVLFNMALSYPIVYFDGKRMELICGRRGEQESQQLNLKTASSDEGSVTCGE